MISLVYFQPLADSKNISSDDHGMVMPIVSCASGKEFRVCLMKGRRKTKDS